MPKKSVVHRNKRREKLAEKLREVRSKLRGAARNINLDPEERYEASLELQKMPRDAGRSRSRNRCKVCGRPRAYNRLTGLCRLHMRIAVLKGMIPGMRKASW